MKFVRWISDLWAMGNRFRIPVGIAFLLLIGILLYPFQSTTVPQWKVRVVDDAGAPVREINVTEHWQHHPLESTDHEEVRRPNGDGFVNFDPRTFRASLARRLLVRIPRGWGSNKERTDPYGAIVAWGSKVHAPNVAVYQVNQTPQTELRVQRLR